jgi:hypothetical protein
MPETDTQSGSGIAGPSESFSLVCAHAAIFLAPAIEGLLSDDQRLIPWATYLIAAQGDFYDFACGSALWRNILHLPTRWEFGFDYLGGFLSAGQNCR